MMIDLQKRSIIFISLKNVRNRSFQINSEKDKNIYTEDG